MNSAVRPEIIERIKKLLELTTSPNENEAKLAMDQAKRLMLKYSLQFEDLSSEVLKEQIKQERYWNDAFNRQGVFEQMPNIIMTIAPIFGVYCLIYDSKQRKPGNHISVDREFELIGFPANIEIARFALDSILAQGIMEARAEYKKFRTVTFGMSFWSGFTIGLYRKFGSFGRSEETGLTVYDKIKQFVENLSTGTIEDQTLFDGVAFNTGVNAGLKAELRRGITSKNEGKLIS